MSQPLDVPGNDLPDPLPTPGTYILVMRCLRRSCIPIGVLGPMPLHRGWYLYVGSAFGPGGLGARLRRHLRADKTKHWHIDTLVAQCAVAEIWYRCEGRDLEHIWARTLLSHQDTVIPLAGFGASDCRCCSHLVWMRSRKEVNRVRGILGARVSISIQRSL
ncbi:MAG TPA: DUF123 domain-containing protein [Gammaproteobacteria bacterium]|jgi:Uri superfamily endonuclease|nr:hypothetical protein [Acidiferrobacteraceae bacterium]HCX88369.1 DUF123 domain-containing protein [Gammaproteobacteria bacterium]